MEKDLKFICDEFTKNPNVNPLTGRKIKFNGPTYKLLFRKCEDYQKQSLYKPMENFLQTYINLIPNELIYVIIDYLSYEEILLLSRSNKYFRATCFDSIYWKNRIKKCYNLNNETLDRILSVGNLKPSEIYKIIFEYKNNFDDSVIISIKYKNIPLLFYFLSFYHLDSSSMLFVLAISQQDVEIFKTLFGKFITNHKAIPSFLYSGYVKELNIIKYLVDDIGYKLTSNDFDYLFSSSSDIEIINYLLDLAIKNNLNYKSTYINKIYDGNLEIDKFLIDMAEKYKINKYDIINKIIKYNKTILLEYIIKNSKDMTVDDFEKLIIISENVKTVRVLLRNSPKLDFNNLLIKVINYDNYTLNQIKYLINEAKTSGENIDCDNLINIVKSLIKIHSKSTSTHIKRKIIIKRKLVMMLLDIKDK